MLPTPRNRAAFFTVVYPGAESFLADFLGSLEAQSHAAFDLIVGNDGLSGLDLAGYRLGARVLPLGGTPAEIREAGLRFVRDQGYEQVVLGDCDDFFSANRVEVSLRLLQSWDVVVNDLDLVDAAGVALQPGYISRRLGNREKLGPELIRDKNLFGLSNTALRVSRLPADRIPADLVAVDWFLFATLLEGGATAAFSAAARTFYRQHGSNTASLTDASPGQPLRGVEVKARHYAALAAAGLERYREPAAAFRRLKQRLAADAAFRSGYCAHMNSTTGDFPFWWETARLPEEPTA